MLTQEKRTLWCEIVISKCNHNINKINECSINLKNVIRFTETVKLDLKVNESKLIKVVHFNISVNYVPV